jgi:mono/diheme cytochrome c family protein
MLRHQLQAAAMASCLFLIACETGRHAPARLRLAAGASVERGKQVFINFECHSCHEVSGSNLPKPTVDPPVPVRLGGTILHERPDARLVTAIVNPNHGITGTPRNLVTVADRSRMPDFASRMTIQQLTDLVEFLQSTYTVRPPENNRFGY